VADAEVRENARSGSVGLPRRCRRNSGFRSEGTIQQPIRGKTILFGGPRHRVDRLKQVFVLPIWRAFFLPLGESAPHSLKEHLTANLRHYRRCFVRNAFIYSTSLSEPC
jgi:hypothetical protein